MEITITLKKTDEVRVINITKKDLKLLAERFNPANAEVEAQKMSDKWVIKKPCPLCQKSFDEDKMLDCTKCVLNIFQMREPIENRSGCVRLIKEILGDDLFFRLGLTSIEWRPIPDVDKIARHKLNHMRSIILDFLNGKTSLDVY
jgi:hypothetical protein